MADTLVCFGVTYNNVTGFKAKDDNGNTKVYEPPLTLDALNAASNGTYTPQSGHAYSSVTVAVPVVTYYTGSGAPSSSLGENGDIYLQTS